MLFFIVSTPMLVKGLVIRYGAFSAPEKKAINEVIDNYCVVSNVTILCSQ